MGWELDVPQGNLGDLRMDSQKLCPRVISLPRLESHICGAGAQSRGQWGRGPTPVAKPGLPTGAGGAGRKGCLFVLSALREHGFLNSCDLRYRQGSCPRPWMFLGGLQPHSCLVFLVLSVSGAPSSMSLPETRVEAQCHFGGQVVGARSKPGG